MGVIPIFVLDRNAEQFLRLGFKFFKLHPGYLLQAVLIKGRGEWALKRDLLDCDYYRMLAGLTEAVNAYRGEYMIQYSWAELTAARLYNETL